LIPWWRGWHRSRVGLGHCGFPLQLIIQMREVLCVIRVGQINTFPVLWVDISKCCGTNSWDGQWWRLVTDWRAYAWGSDSRAWW
jgi:hypothetical protein